MLEQKAKNKFDEELQLNLKMLIEEVFKPSYFPNIKYGSAYSSTGSGRYGGSKMKIHGFNEIFKNSIIEYKGNYRFLHYTSVEVLINILKSKAIRMYDLNHLEDPQEFVFGFKHLANSNNPALIKKYKAQLFSFSLIEYDEDTINENLDLWRTYGRNGKGVCIDISISPDNIDKWFRFFIGTMQYRDLEKTNEVTQLKEKYEQFVAKYNFRINNFSEFLSAILSFYKTTPYKNENEMRLLSHIEFDAFKNEHELSDVEQDVNSRFEPVFYNPIVLETEDKVKGMNDSEKHFHETKPHIKINEVLMGYNIPNCFEIKKVLRSLSEKKLGYTPNIRVTPLQKYFNK